MKRKLKKQIFSMLLCLVWIVTCLPLTVNATNSAEKVAEGLSDDIVILYTNDVHTYIDGPLSYDVIAAIKEELQTQYKHVILADAGDHIQGTAYGSMDKGESIIRLMNASGYDVATLGNHEFDYKMQGCLNVIEWAEFPYISCNFYQEADGVRGDNVLDDYVIFDCGEEKVAFVGITTPETFSKSTPAYFQDENGNFIYGIAGGEEGLALQQDVQKAIDEAEDEGATKVIALGHMGMDSASAPFTSEDTIAGVSGLDAFIDGHSHTVTEGKEILDQEGNPVLLTQTGEYFDRIGMMVIDSETGDITTDFIEYEEEAGTLSSELYSSTELISDSEVKALKDAWLKEIDDKLGQNIGFSEVTLDNYDSNGNRLVRSQETNSGDFAADALYYLFDDMGLDVDVAVMNGGGVRNQAVSGDISYKTCKEMHPFGNVACLQTVTGQQILDMLEWGARHAGVAEEGSFLHVSGITYAIDTSVEDTTQADEMDVWLGGPLEYRVRDIKIYNKDTNNWEEIDLSAKYNLAGYNYTLRDLGGGFAMLDGAVNVLDYVMEDYMVLANYISSFENGTVKADNSPLLAKYPGLLIDYSDVNGNGRINVVEDTALWVGGVEVTKENAKDVFGDGKVSYDAETKTLTLNHYSYEGEGYLYEEYKNEETKETEYYSAVIYSEDSITIKAEGNNVIRNTFNAGDKKQYGDGIVSNGDITIIGEGMINIYGAYAIEGPKDIIIDGSNLYLETTYDAIASQSGDIIMKNNAEVMIDSDAVGIMADVCVSITDSRLNADTGKDGIYAYKSDVIITDSQVDINAGTDGIYAYDGSVIINSEKVGISAYGPWLEGTKVSVKVGDKYGVFAYKDLTMDEKLTISSPTDAKIGEVKKKDYILKTVLVGDEVAKEMVIEPLGYSVSIKGLDNNMVALAPYKKSLNETYCGMYQVEDFSRILDTEKEGYLFAGWYTDESCTSGKEYNFNDPVTADITIYAKWNKRYKPMVADTNGGSVTIAPEEVTKGETVTIIPAPKEGKEVYVIFVTDQLGNPIPVVENNDGTYTFIQPENEVTVKVMFGDEQEGDSDEEDEEDEEDTNAQFKTEDKLFESPQTYDKGADDPVVNAVYKLSPEQRKTLLAFLENMVE